MTRNPVLLVARTACAVLVMLTVAACGSGAGDGWTYAPLGPTAGASPGGSPGSSPAGSPVGSPGLTIDVATEQATSSAFTPNTLTAPANTTVTVNYNNNSNLLHNIRFFNGPDNTAQSLGATDSVTGPSALRSVTFTTPAQPGSYYFWCDVHVAAMAGTLQVQ